MLITPQDFVSKWKRVTAREKQTSQEHFLDICQLVAHSPQRLRPDQHALCLCIPSRRTIRV